MERQHEEEVKRRLYKTLFATFVALGVIFIVLRFFAPSVGSFLGLISKIGKPEQKDDTAPPSPPYFYSSPSATNQKKISLKGFSEPNSKVTVFANGPEVGSVNADAAGTFSIENIPLIEGRNTIYAKAEDTYQNQSEKSQTLEITYDNKKPKITITEPKDESTVRNLNQRISVKGTLDEKCEVKINEKLAITRPDNSFELLLGVEEGEVEIKVEAVDEAGNKSDESIKITYIKAGV